MGKFKIDVDNFHWINGAADDPQDLCLHGHVRVEIGGIVLEDTGTVSATALYLLKTLGEDKIMAEFDIQMIPCCGHALFANEDLSEVMISGCDKGTDWSTVHEGDHVRLILPDGHEAVISLADYQEEVYRFADKVEAFYISCAAKILPEDEFDRNGYIAFWNEWYRRRGQQQVYGAVNRKGEAWFTDMQRVFQAIGGRQKDYNWLLTDCVCYPENPETAAMLRQSYCWLTGEELTDLVERENFQWIWAVLSGFDKSVEFSDVMKYDLPKAEDYNGFWSLPMRMQHPLASVEIVPWDSSMTVIFSEDEDVVRCFIEGFLESEDMVEYVAKNSMKL